MHLLASCHQVAVVVVVEVVVVVGMLVVVVGMFLKKHVTGRMMIAMGVMMRECLMLVELVEKYH